MTDTGVDQHHWLFQDFALGTVELNLNRFGVVWGTASPIIAEATVPRLVCLHTSAVPVFKANGFQGLLCSDTFLPLLREILRDIRYITAEDRKQLKIDMRGYRFTLKT